MPLKQVTLATGISLLTGILGHLIFYPIIESWNNQRIRRLAQPSIGVLLNTIPFLAWLKVLQRENDNCLVLGYVAYSLSFLWNGAGVALGYVFDDWRLRNE